MNIVVFKFPTMREVSEVGRLYSSHKNRLLSEKVKTRSEMMFYLNKYEIYTYAMEQEIERLEGLSKIKYRKPYSSESAEETNKEIDRDITEAILGERTVDLVEYFTKETQKTIPDNDIKRYNELCGIRDSAVKYSLEAICEKERTMRLTQLCSYNWDNGERVWKDWEMFCGEKNRTFQTAIINLCAGFLNGLPQSKLRKMARHTMWRSRWISATKTGSPLFDGAISQWDHNKTFLCYWSNFYDSIAGAYEPPEQFVIEDDELLDGWLEKKARENKSGSTESMADKEGSVAFFRNRVNPVPKKG